MLKTFLICSFILLPCLGMAQSKASFIQIVGMEASLGVRTFGVESNLHELSGLASIKSGGSLGVIIGNDRFRLPIRLLGLYLGAIKDQRTIDIVEVGSDLHISLLPKFTKAIDLYSISGLSYRQFRFLGTYAEAVSSSSMGEPFIGRIDMASLNFGMGVQYQLKFHKHFLNFFLEGTRMVAVAQETSSMALNGTKINPGFTTNFGFRVGRKN